MRRFYSLLSITLVLLLLVLSFNAYACLLPVGSSSTSEMGNGCSTPEEQPARQVCDVFKTFNVEASGLSQPIFDSQMLWFGETLSCSYLSLSCTKGFLKHPFSSDRSSPLLGTITTVLRI